MFSESQRPGSKHGFTLFEIIASVSVMVIIMTMLAMGLGGVLPASKSKQANTDIVRIQQALEAYQGVFGEYPKQVAGGATMEAILFNALSGTLAPNGKLGNFANLLDRSSLKFENATFPIAGAVPALLGNTIIDPWGNPYRYRYDPDGEDWENFNYVLFSTGPDGAFSEVTAAGQKDEDAASNQDNIYAL